MAASPQPVARYSAGLRTNDAPACGSGRVVANDVRPSRNFDKVWPAKRHIIGRQRPRGANLPEQYSIFVAYLYARHRHGAWPT